MTPREAVWKSVPDSTVPYDRAWLVVSNAVTQKFDLETSDGASGYLRTAWKVVETLAFVGPYRRSRVIVRVEGKEPFRVRLKVESQTKDGDNWVDQGNDEKLEQEILGEIGARLK